MRFALVLIFLTTGALAQSQQPSPSETELRTNKQQQAAPAANQSQPEKQSAPQLPPVIYLSPPGKSEAEREEERHERDEKAALDRRLVDLTSELSSYTGGLFYATVVLAIATVLLVVATAGLIILGFRQENMARTHERAYIGGGGPMRVRAATGELLNPDEGWVTIQNYGRTPGTIKKLEWGFCDESLFPKNIPISKILDKGLLPAGAVRVHDKDDIRPPNSQAHIFHAVGSFSLSEHNGKIFFGRYTYEDVFHDTHYSAFVLKLGPRIGESNSVPGSAGYSDFN